MDGRWIAITRAGLASGSPGRLYGATLRTSDMGGIGIDNGYSCCGRGNAIFAINGSLMKVRAGQKPYLWSVSCYDMRVSAL